jgi:hypothetical protein
VLREILLFFPILLLLSLFTMFMFLIGADDEIDKGVEE